MTKEKYILEEGGFENQRQGTLHERYAVYVEACESLGIAPLSFDQWIEN